jgi:Na+-driven multidrug efflux pump
VAAATVLRVLAMAMTALTLAGLTEFPGACIGALALSAGVSAEALLTRYLARQAIAETLACEPENAVTVPGYAAIARFYLPLALTPFIGLCVHPLVTFFLGRSAFPIESLAVLPVLHALTFVFRAVGLSYQEVALALLARHPDHYRKISRFAWGLGWGVTLLLGLIAYTPLTDFWLGTVSGLTPELTEFGRTPLRILCFLPAFTVLICFQRAVLMNGRATTPITAATMLEVSGIFALMAGLVLYSTLPGIVAAALAYLAGRLVAVGFLLPFFARARLRLARLPAGGKGLNSHGG